MIRVVVVTFEGHGLPKSVRVYQVDVNGVLPGETPCI